MSKVDRLLKRSKDLSSRKYLKKLFSADNNQTTIPGLPLCPRCGSPLRCGFGNASGDWHLCLKCGETVPNNTAEGE